MEHKFNNELSQSLYNTLRDFYKNGSFSKSEYEKYCKDLVEEDLQEILETAGK